VEHILLHVLVAVATLCFFGACFFFGLYASLKPWRKKYISSSVWRYWKETIAKETDEHWHKLLNRAGSPFSWGKAEWLALQCLLGISLFVLIVLWELLEQDGSVSILLMILLPSVGFWIPYVLLRWWANYREEILSLDIARFINRYVNLLENHVPHYMALDKAARPTKLLKRYIPSLSEWNRDRFEALERWKQDLGVDDAIILVSNIRTIEQLTPEVIAVAMHRLEWAVDHRRMFRHRKKIKSLGVGYSIIVYPSFYMGLIVAMFPWYKLLTEILDKYLV